MSRSKLDGSKPNTVALLGTYLPRLCGIGTFTKDLHDGLVLHMRTDDVRVLAMDDVPAGYAYPDEVHFQIQAHQQTDYRRAADLLNINQIDLVIVQHEYGIYGGAAGSLVLDLMRRLRMPVITTLHTVLTKPTEAQKKVTHRLAELSERVVVMSHRAESILTGTYSVCADKIAYIPHGIPDVPFTDSSFFKDRFGVEGRKVLLTFGLLSPGKGLEVALDAMPGIVAKHPDVVYIILGATHPHVLRHEGDAYRNSLVRMTQRLGISEHVMFQDRFVSLEELCGYIGAADVYVTPYLNPAQITSGTLAYAMGAGKAVVSTPYWYAEELLAEGRGRLFPFGDSAALTEHVNHLLDHDAERDAMRKRAYLYCRSMVWRDVAGQYLELGMEVLRSRHRAPESSVLKPEPEESSTSLVDTTPKIDLGHLMTLTDDTGMLQHATFTIPDRNHGYATDDNARALIAVVSYHDLRQDISMRPLAATYLAFLRNAFNDKEKRFRSFMSYDRHWLEEIGTEDAHGRALWALGLLTAYPLEDGMLELATRIFTAGLPVTESFSSPRGWAFTLVGIHGYLRRFGGDTQVRHIRQILANRLHALFKEQSRPEWPWCEDRLTYDNAKLAHALILAGQWLPDPKMTTCGLHALQWLLRVQTNEEGALSVVGNQGWMERDGKRALFDQQPVEAMGLIEACIEAYRVTRDPMWTEEVRRCLNWFLGQNDTHSILYDFTTGGCRDGLTPDGVNSNEGAESTLAWLISLIATYQLSRDERGVDDHADH